MTVEHVQLAEHTQLGYLYVCNLSHALYGSHHTLLHLWQLGT